VGARRNFSAAAAELDDVAAVAFGGAAGGEHFEFAHGFAFGGDFLSEFAAGVGFSIKGLGDGGGAAKVAEEKNFDFEVAAVVGNAKHVSDVDFSGGFGGLVVGLNAAEFAGSSGERAGLKEAGRPKVFVDADRVHGIL
jgi:hypothetical protein